MRERARCRSAIHVRRSQPTPASSAAMPGHPTPMGRGGQAARRQGRDGADHRGRSRHSALRKDAFMKITDVRTVVLTGPMSNDPSNPAARPLRSAAFIEVHTDTELVGIGETYLGYQFPE